jgi:5-formyltetrahydrofolate cyclo-ligase
MTNNTRRLRAILIARRSGLTSAEVRRASSRVTARIRFLPALARCHRIACYFAINGEIDCRALMSATWARGRQVLLPILYRQKLRFVPFRPDGKTKKNIFGIPEPVFAKRDLVDPRTLDVVLTPLVAFDLRGNRLGMGGGYYDRSFAFLRNRSQWQRPHLIGLAHNFQKVPSLQTNVWDIPLETVITESDTYHF